MTPFTNEVIPIENLPKYEEAETTPIQKKYWNVMLLKFLIRFLFLGAVVTGFSFMPEIIPYRWFLIGGFIIVMTAHLMLKKMAFHKRCYALREMDIIYRRGLLSTITTLIPFTRIQHVALNEGFIERYYGLAQLQIYTAGGSSSDLKISGLLKADAGKLKAAIMLHIGKRGEDNPINEAAE
ncbi:MAG: PH domain-containing protein [Ginsengibacter sp.]